MARGKLVHLSEHGNRLNRLEADRGQRW
jgi:hypothetical protein